MDARRKNRRAGRGRISRIDRAPTRQQNLGWLVAGATITLLVVTVGITTHRRGARHPTPRPTAEQPLVLRGTRYASVPYVRDTYAMAAAVPDVLDGLYCYCQCSRHSGHYSLLDCFASDHASGCDICMTEARLAHRMAHEGADLRDIRKAVDDLYPL